MQEEKYEELQLVRSHLLHWELSTSEINVFYCSAHSLSSYRVLLLNTLSCPIYSEEKLQGKCILYKSTIEEVAWLNRSNIIFAGQDKWSLDPRVDLVTKGQLEYSLRIQKVDVYDEGSYTCSIQTKQKPKTSHVYLIVQVPASIYKVSEDVIVNEGSNVTLSCLASGRPDPIITWRLAAGWEEFLDIIGIMRNQAGRYECKASNDVATPDVKYVNVVVNYPPTIQKIQSSETPVGRVGMLQCDANAVPKPEFEWYRDEKSINIQMLGTTTILVFSNVSEEDYGNYTCVATNRLGIQNASVFLYSECTQYTAAATHRNSQTQREGSVSSFKLVSMSIK
uniref:Limbic system associated membrane protein n=1 Tax=Neogobius melanostomus TaxID=47308 RepID=A0A8C6TRH8_9GOBI